MFFYSKNTHKLCKFKTADKIREVSLSLFSKQGFFNTSIHHIQKKSQISIGSIYNHFKSKKDIADSLQKEILEQMNLAFVDTMSQHESFQKKYYNIIKLLFVMTEKESRTMVFIFHSKYSEYSDLNKSIFQLKPFENIYNEFCNSCDNNIIKQQLNSIDLIMATLFSLPIRLIQLRLDGVIKEPISNQVDIIFKTVWNGLYDK